MAPSSQGGPSLFVTGAAGFIAHHFIESMLKAGTPVVGMDNFDPFYPAELKRKNVADLEAIAKKTGTPFRFREGDITALDKSWFKEERIHVALHLAAKAGVRPSLKDPEAYLATNVQGTLRVLAFCKDRDIRTVLFGSSSSVYGNSSPIPFREDIAADRPISPYAASKRAGELYCHAYAHLYGMRIAALRLFTVYGPRQRPDLAIHKFAMSIHEGSPITLFGDGKTERDYTFVADIVEGLKGAMGWAEAAGPGTFEVFNLGGAKATTLKRMVEILEKELKIPARIKWDEKQPGDVDRTLADTTKAGKAFGYAPKVSIDEGIERFVEWFKDTKESAKRAA